MRVLVTGCSGFLGTCVMERMTGALSAKGFEVRGVDRVGGLDLSDAARLHQELQKFKPEGVIHLAGLAKVSAETTLEDYFRSNFLLTQNLLDALTGLSCRLVLASSVHVYGPESRAVDETSPVQPRNPYAFSKYLAERLVQQRVKEHPQLSAVVIRYGNLVGPGQKPGFVVPDLCQKIRARTSFQLREPQHTRYFLDVKDAASATVALLAQKLPSPFEVVNLVAEKSLTIGALYRALCALAQSAPTATAASETGVGPSVSNRKLLELVPRLQFSPVEEALRRAWQS